MDGIGNAKENARYLKAYFAIEHAEVSTIIDLGFRYGHLFLEIIRAFIPALSLH